MKSTCKGDEVKHSIPDHNTSMANTALVQNIVVNVSGTFRSVTQTQNIAVQPTGPINPLVAHKHLKLDVWKISEEPHQGKVYRELLQSLLHISEDRDNIYLDGPLPLKSNNPLIMWSYKIKIFIYDDKIIISSLP